MKSEGKVSLNPSEIKTILADGEHIQALDTIQDLADELADNVQLKYRILLLQEYAKRLSQACDDLIRGDLNIPYPDDPVFDTAMQYSANVHTLIGSIFPAWLFGRTMGYEAVRFVQEKSEEYGTGKEACANE